MKLTLLLLATAFSTSWALTCKSCDENTSTKCSAQVDKLCTVATGESSCYTSWIVDKDGNEVVKRKGCNDERIDYDEPQEQCSLSSSYGVYDEGTCYCAGEKCNEAAKPAILTAPEDERLKCWHCPYASTKLECAKQDRDWTNLGKEVTCPKGVRYCYISGENSQTFYRGCDTKIYDDMNDDDTKMGLGFCDGSGDCTCGQNKCNTGFHGVKCHSYSLSDCDDGNILNTGGTVQCLTGSGSCAVIKGEIQDFCHAYQYNCGFGRNSSGCESGKNAAGVVDEAEVCYCDATGGDDLCDPTNSSPTLVSSFVLILAVTLFAFK